MHAGSCLCGAVTYEVEGTLEPIICCHCSKCRKANGSAFNTAVPIKTSDLHILSGHDNLAEFESSPGVYRVFCQTCASPLYSRRDAQPEGLKLRIGTLDTPVEGTPSIHIFVGSRAPWDEIHGDAKQYKEGLGS